MRRMVAALLILGVACSKQETKQAVTKTVNKVSDAITVPWNNKPDDVASREQERFDQQYRQLESFRAQQQLQQQQQQQEQQRNAAPASAGQTPAKTAAPSWFRFVTFLNVSFAQQINESP